jgi:hypothetical protein
MTKEQLPKHEAEYLEVVDETEHEDWPELECPACAGSFPISWSDLERGTQHECKSCGYKWEIA